MNKFIKQHLFVVTLICMGVRYPLRSSWFTNNESTYYKTHSCRSLTYQTSNETGIISHSQRPCVCMRHNIIQIHNNIMWD